PGARAALEDIRTGADTDGDGVPDAIDNCPLVANPSQADTGGMGPGSPPDKIGDACQCGSVAGDGHVDATDVAAYRAALANPTGAPLSADAQTRCRVLGRTGGCDIRQVSAIRRAIAAPSLAPIQSGPAAQFCVAALGS
ncbi:MAG TPA: thrombospondin type 3 repeat-containing protein, partial [Myxococcota bacterium]|nr:thrombospondin type 3 repeat-containing protein [Myxococcota bacterium]